MSTSPAARRSASAAASPTKPLSPPKQAAPKNSVQTAPVADEKWKKAGERNALKMTGAAIDGGPKSVAVPPKVPGFKGEFVTDDGHDDLPIPGSEPATFNYSMQSLLLTGGPGRTEKAYPVEPEGGGVLDAVRAEFDDECRYADGLPEGFAVPERSLTRSVETVGSAGSMFSLLVEDQIDNGKRLESDPAPTPDTSSRLETYNAKTGKKVVLGEVLNQAQFNSVAQSIKAALPTLPASGGVKGNVFQAEGAAAKLANENFALVTNKKGEVMIEVAWGSEDAPGKMAHFTFKAPTDDLFRKQIGLPPLAVE